MFFGIQWVASSRSGPDGAKILRMLAQHYTRIPVGLNNSGKNGLYKRKISIQENKQVQYDEL